MKTFSRILQDIILVKTAEYLWREGHRGEKGTAGKRAPQSKGHPMAKGTAGQGVLQGKKQRALEVKGHRKAKGTADAGTPQGEGHCGERGTARQRALEMKRHTHVRFQTNFGFSRF